MLSIGVRWVVTGLSVLWIAGCSGAEDGQRPNDLKSTGPVGCGTLTCDSTETCLVSRPLRTISDGPESYSCIKTPSGCGGLELCDCPATQGDIEGKPVTGCSLLGERSIYVADVTCGDRSCTSNEYCLVTHTGLGVVTPILSRACRTLPSACELAFCSLDCRAEVAAIEGVEISGCLTSGSTLGIDAY